MATSHWLSRRAQASEPSPILEIAREVRELRARGARVLDLTVGDYDATGLPLPSELKEEVTRAFQADATGYPPMLGVQALREAIVEHTFTSHGVRVPVDRVLVSSGARPICYGMFQVVLDPGDRVAFGVPSWSSHTYAVLAGATPVPLDTRPEEGFLPTLEQLLKVLPTARLLSLNTPLNPAGTVMSSETLARCLRAVVEENELRLKNGRPPVFVLVDQVYSELTLHADRHVMAEQLVPEAAPWVTTVDAVSKSLAATGLRVGWGIVPEALRDALRDLVSDTGAWAPTPIQWALARFLVSETCAKHQAHLRRELVARHGRLQQGVRSMEASGLPVHLLPPQAGLYALLRIDWHGRRHRGHPIQSDEQLRQLLLAQAGVALVPLSAFSAPRDTGWFRASLGATDVAGIEQACDAVARTLGELD